MMGLGASQGATILFRDPAGNVRPSTSQAYVGDSWFITLLGNGGDLFSETEKVNGVGSDTPFPIAPIQSGYDRRQWGGTNYKYTAGDIGQHVQTWFANGTPVATLSFNVSPNAPAAECNPGFDLVNGSCVAHTVAQTVLTPASVIQTPMVGSASNLPASVTTGGGAGVAADSGPNLWLLGALAVGAFLFFKKGSL